MVPLRHASSVIRRLASRLAWLPAPPGVARAADGAPPAAGPSRAEDGALTVRPSVDGPGADG